MRDLVWKDVAGARWFLWLGWPLFVAQLASMGGSPPAFLLVALLFTGFFAFGPIALEESQGTEALWCSLPVSRRDIVLARYAATLLGVAVGLATSVLVAWISGGWPLAPVPLASIFFLLVVTGALFLPCYFRLGAGRGLQAFAVVSLGLAVILSVVGSAIVAAGGGIEPRELATRIEAWGRGLDWGLAVVLVAFALVSFVASAALSVSLYERRDC